MNQYFNRISLSGIVMPFCIVATLVRAHEPISSSENSKTSLDLTQIIEQVSHNQTAPHSCEFHRFENEIAIHGLREDEFLIDTNITYGPSIDNQCSVSVAFDGTNYLIVWQDDRNGSWDIYGTRVAQRGTILDPAGIAISTAVNEQSTPAVAFDGTNFLVVWTDWRADSSSDIYGTRVSQSGVVLDQIGIAISTAANDQLRPSVAFDGTNYLVVWQDNRNDPYEPDICGARVETSGSVLDSSAITVSTATYSRACPSIAFDGINYLIVWSDCFHIYGARVDQSGSVLDTAGIVIGFPPSVNLREYSPSIAFDGNNYLVVWSRKDPRAYWTSDVYGARVDTAGNVLDPQGIGICTIGNSQWVGSVAFDGMNYLVVWQDCGIYYPASVCGARVNTSGTVLDPTGIVIISGWLGYGEPRCPSVAFGARTYFVLWQDTRNGSSNIYGTWVSRSGAVNDTLGICMSIDVSEQRNPAVHFADTDYLVVWEDTRNDHSDIYGTRVSQSGNTLDPFGIPVSTVPWQQWFPAIAYNGSHHLVAWYDDRAGYEGGIHSARITPNGNVLDTVEIEIDFGRYYSCLSVTSCGWHYLVVWQKGLRVKGARVHQTGAVIDYGGFLIADQYSSNPSVAFDGTNYLVVWAASSMGEPPDIYGARVTQNGTVLDPPPGIPVSTAQGKQSRPSVAFDGTNYLVVWEDERDGSDADVYGARVTPLGSILDPYGICLSRDLHEQWSPSVAFDGINYFVVWQDLRNGEDWDIHGAKLDTSGTMIDSFAVSRQPGDQISPVVVHGTGNQLLVVYSGWTGEHSGKIYNTMRIWGKFYPFVGIKEQPIAKPIEKNEKLTATIFRGPLHLPKGKKCKVFDITGRIVEPNSIQPGIYFIGVDGVVTQKVVKVR